MVVLHQFADAGQSGTCTDKSPRCGLENSKAWPRKRPMVYSNNASFGDEVQRKNKL
jgi:hypothetical protein